MAVTSSVRTHDIYAGQNANIAIKCLQGEQGIKMAEFHLKNSDANHTAVNLTDATVVLYNGTKSDGTPCWSDCTVSSAANGVVTLTQNIGMTDVPGIVSGRIIVFAANGNIQFNGINLVVKNNPSLASLSNSHAFLALQNALNKVEVITPGGTITVDDELSTESVDPVQNKIVTAAINLLTSTKIDSDDAVKFVNLVTNPDSTAPSGDPVANCISPDTVYWGTVNNVGCAVITMSGSNYRTQYKFSTMGKLEYRTTHKDNGVWGSWGSWNAIGSTDNIQDEAVTPAKLDRAYVEKSQTIAGVDFQDNITATELASALASTMVSNHGMVTHSAEIFIGSTDKTASETGTDIRAYQVNDRYINKYNGKIWYCSNVTLDTSSIPNKFVYTWASIGNLYNYPITTTYTLLATAWNNDNEITLSTLPTIAAGRTRVDVDFGQTVYDQLISDGCSGLCVTTDVSGVSPVFTMHAYGNTPTVDITVQLTLWHIIDA